MCVVPAGERWPSGALRPAVEDLLGAGAIIANLPGRWSPEAAAAVGAFRAVDPAEQLAASTSGRELCDAGFAEDVRLATAIDASTTVPLLARGAFAAH